MQIIIPERQNARRRAGNCEWCGKKSNELWGEVVVDRSQGEERKHIVRVCEGCKRTRPWGSRR